MNEVIYLYISGLLYQTCIINWWAAQVLIKYSKQCSLRKEMIGISKLEIKYTNILRLL